MDNNIDNLNGTESLDELEAMLEAIEREPDSELDDGTATEQKRTYNPRRRRARWQPVTNRAAPSRAVKGSRSLRR